MNLSIKWLNDYIKAGMKIEDFTHGMTMSGSKVEKWTDLSAPLEKVVCGKVVSIEKHADSDKLWVAQVDIGDVNNASGCSPALCQIVTGAQNVTQGAFVPVVLEGGTVLNRSDGSVMKIKRGKLRGVESMGMMCSIDELGLTKDDLPYADTDGILILDDDPEADKLTAGMDVTAFLGIKDVAVEFEITNNRPDCLSIIGLAREAGAAFNLPVNIKKPAFKGVDGDIGLTVKVENKQWCSRYMAAVVKNVKITPSPRWLVERLRASGVRAINNIVDITNFVMLEYGHPMHAFDKRAVEGGEITVRNAFENEKITLLDGEERTLNAQTLVIADAKKPIAVAGVMGGEFSGIMPSTTEFVFESACFDGVSVRKTAQRIGRRTESSARFEKGISPVTAETALFRALELVEMLNCGEAVKTIIDEDFSNKEPVKIKFNPERINQILGSDIPESKQIEILERLGFMIKDGFAVVPPYRIDMHLECDLAEEVARIYGYNEIPSSLPLVRAESCFSEAEIFEQKLGIIMQGQGCHETVTFSFISPKSYVKACISDTDDASVVIRNPLGEETGVMRISMLPSMLEVITRNYNNRNTGGRFYEIGEIYERVDIDDIDILPKENKILSMGLYGESEDFLTLKGIIEELLEKLGINAVYKALTADKSYHTGRCAEIIANGERLGFFGEIHPVVLENWGIGTRTYCAELSAEKLFEHSNKTPKFRALPKYPSMTRDLSLICAPEITAGEIAGIIGEKTANLEQVSLFDMYTGEQIPEGKKSLSYKLVFRRKDGTLTDEETDAAVAKILKSLAQKGITLRYSP
ncbi:MAG: phenylalanine--tRNA ligase subunit beta [Oscillospiraceae bacterium]|nr:phenylalanine--tRNA ligase subunit beta [Oscillospiraceae bacterium]